MSSNANQAVNPTWARDRDTTRRARSNRGRGRGRPPFKGPMSSISSTAGENGHKVVENVVTPAHEQFTPKRRKPQKTTNTRDSTVTTGRTENLVNEIVVNARPMRNKELPPHIAGAAVDPQSLASRVQELAIGGHAHSNSTESRFTMSLNWADEEDDPDSLPNLDDWNISRPNVITGDIVDAKTPTGPLPNPPSAIIQHTEEAVPHHPQPNLAGGSSSCEKEERETEYQIPTPVILSNVQDHNEGNHPAPRQRASGSGTAASIWAPKQPINGLSKGEIETRHPSAARRRSVHSGTPERFPRDHTPSETTIDTQETQRGATSNRQRRSHARPVITSDAIARISRSLGQRATT